MKITVDLDDFWMEEDNGTLTEQIKDHIIHSVKTEVYNSIKIQVKELSESIIKRQIEESIKEKINESVLTFISEDKFCKRYSSQEKITLSEYILEELSRATIDRNYISDYVKKEGEKHGSDLKKRYDMLFASGIVAKMHENGLLKEDVASKLLGNNN